MIKTINGLFNSSKGQYKRQENEFNITNKTFYNRHIMCLYKLKYQLEFFNLFVSYTYYYKYKYITHTN